MTLHLGGLGVSDEEATRRFPGYRALNPHLRLTEQPPLAVDSVARVDASPGR